MLYLQNEEGTVQTLFLIDMFLTLAGRNPAGKYQVLVEDTRLAGQVLGEEMTNFCIPDVFDDVAEQLVRHGFEFINPFAEKFGPLHCIKKYLRRG